MTTATKLELRINLGPGVVGQIPSGQEKQTTKDSKLVSKTKTGARTIDSKPDDSSDIEMPTNAEDVPLEEQQKMEEDGKRKKRRSRKEREDKVKERERKRKSKTKDADSTPKPILRTKDTPPSRSRVVIKEVDAEKTKEIKRNKTTPNRNTPAITINTPLRGDVDSPLKPYRFRAGGPALRNSVAHLTTPATAKSEERKPLDVHAGMKALRELLSAIGIGTRMLEFKDMMQVKVNIRLASHISRSALEELKTFEKIIEELSVLWKINRMDLDLLEHLLNSIGMLERFTYDLEKYKSTIRYSNLPASSEREVTTIISSLHNILQGSKEASCTYTTMCFLHYGDVYSFNRAKLSCMKAELARLLQLHQTQITYIAKVAANGNGYVTVFQMPVSISKKIVLFARKNDEILMSLGLKGIQVTGSDGLRYTQSLSYLQEKIPVGTQTSADDIRILSRNAKTAPTLSLLPPLGQRQKTVIIRPATRVSSVASSRKPQTPNIDLPNVQRYDAIPTPAPNKPDPAVVSQVDPNEAKFERRVNLLKSTLTDINQHQHEDLVSVLLDQIQTLHRKIASLKKDLKEKSRELNSSQGFVQKAEKEIKAMEMRLETKAHQISETNEQLLKRTKKLLAENARLKDGLQQVCAEVDIHRQLEKDNRFGNSIRAVRISRLPTAIV